MANKPPNQSPAFFMAYERCMEQRPLPDGRFQMPVVPAIVCLVFSIELGLKALAEAEGTKVWGHKLADLFGKLSPKLQGELVKSVGLSQTAFDAELAAATNMFVDWRYVHEQTNPKANLEFLRSFGRAVQQALSALT